MIYWLIGQPGCGKTTLAKRLAEKLISIQRPTIHLDGDALRSIFAVPYNKETLGKEWRIEQTRILQRFVAYIADQGINVVVSTVNPYKAVREEFKKSRKDVREIHVWSEDLLTRKDKWVKDFEEPLAEAHIGIKTGGKFNEDHSFAVMWSLLN